MLTDGQERRVRRYYLSGLECTTCALKMEKAFQKTAGLENVKINFALRSLEIPSGTESQVNKIVDAIEPGVKLVEKPTDDLVKPILNWQKLAPVLVSLALLAIGVFVPLEDTWGTIIFGVAYLIVGIPIISQAGRNLFKGQLFDEYALMTIATFGAIALGEFAEAVAVMSFYSLGEYFQERAIDRSRRSIAALLRLRPDHANLKIGDEVSVVPPQAVSVGQVIVIKPGERVPLDGQVLAGESFLDTSPLTGESVPRKVRPGDEVLAGTVNGAGLLEMKVAKNYTDSAVAKILEMVERASERKAPTERFITTFARFYTPAVLAGATLIALLPPFLIPGEEFAVWFYRALVMLVISCPCALVVSVPLSYFGGIGAASKQGILFKGANYLDALSKIHTIVFDKTGTLTKGSFDVVEVRTYGGYSREALLSIAANLESHSTHPIAKAICAADELRKKYQLSEIKELSGRGMSALWEGRVLLVGNARLLQENGVHLDAQQQWAGASVSVAFDGQLIGEIVVSDELKRDARQAIQELKNLGVRHISMLTGDLSANAAHVAAELGLDSYEAELLPQEKVAWVETRQEQLRIKHEKLIFVGDGINDAPVIARADVGIAMGGLGSDAAIEAADVVIMRDSPSKVATAVRLSRFTALIVRQNIVLSLGVKLIFITLGAMGLATIWGAVFADVGVALLAIANSLRVLRFDGEQATN